MRLGILVLRAILAVVLGICLMVKARANADGGVGYLLVSSIATGRDIGVEFLGQRPQTVCLFEY